MITRRAAVGALIAGPSLITSLAHGAANKHSADKHAKARIVELEKRHGGRLGVAILDTGSGTQINHRWNERFALCSTFKFLAAAAVLARVDQNKEQLDRRVSYKETDLVDYSPVTKERMGTGMTIGELCEAAVTLSDNTAGNLLLASFGGPAGLTAYVRTLGDNVTRLDRCETALNEARPGDMRDTTTPRAMVGTMHKLIVGDALSQPSRDQLIAWLVASKTGDTRLRAGLPKTWRVGDKTGTGRHATVNDIAVAWPPNKPPILIAAYYTGSDATVEQRNAVLADLAHVVGPSV